MWRVSLSRSRIRHSKNRVQFSDCVGGEFLLVALTVLSVVPPKKETGGIKAYVARSFQSVVTVAIGESGPSQPLLPYLDKFLGR